MHFWMFSNFTNAVVLFNYYSNYLVNLSATVQVNYVIIVNNIIINDMIRSHEDAISWNEIVINSLTKDHIREVRSNGKAIPLITFLQSTFLAALCLINIYFFSLACYFSKIKFYLIRHTLCNFSNVWRKMK